MVDSTRNETKAAQSLLDAEVSTLLTEAADCELVEIYVSTKSQAAVETLIRRHAPMVSGVIRRVIQNSSDAEDAFQATFLILLKSAKKIRKHSSVAAWLYGVAYRTAARARMRHHENKLIDVDSTALASQDSPDPLTRISEQFQLELLDKELQQLSSPIKETLIDHHLLGYTASQIADRTDVSISAVEGRLRRGRAALRHALSRRGISFSVAAVLAAKYQSTCQAATSNRFEHLLQTDWFNYAVHNTSHLSVPKSLHSLASKDIAIVTKSLIPKFGLASAIAVCSVAAISAPILLTAKSGRSISSVMIGTASAQEAQTGEVALDATAGGSGSAADAGGGGGAPAGLGGGASGGGSLDFGPAGGGGGSFEVANEEPTGSSGSAPGGLGGGSTGGATGGATGGGGISGGGPSGQAYGGGLGGSSGAPGTAPGGPGYGGSPYGGGSAPSGGSGFGGTSSTPGAPTGGGGGYGGGSPYGTSGGAASGFGGGAYGGGAAGGPGSSGMMGPGGLPSGMPGMPGSAPGGYGGPGPGGMMGMGMGGMGGGGTSETKTYKNAGNKKPEWLTRGEETLGEAEQAREELRAKLRTKITPEFNNMPLTSVLAALSEQSGIAIGTSLFNPETEGIITRDEPVTLQNLGSIPLRRTLEILSSSLGDAFTYVVEPEGIQIVSKGSDEAKQRRYYDLSYIVSDDEEFMKVQDSISILEDVKAVKVGSMLVVTAEEKQHLEIEELLSRIAQMPKENL